VTAKRQTKSSMRWFLSSASSAVSSSVPIIVPILAEPRCDQGRFWSWETAAAMLGAIASGGLLLPLLALLFSPLLELLFGYVTDIELLKLANFNHPVLKDLIVDMEPFFAKYRAVKPYLINDDPPPQHGERLRTTDPLG